MSATTNATTQAPVLSLAEINKDFASNIATSLEIATLSSTELALHIAGMFISDEFAAQNLSTRLYISATLQQSLGAKANAQVLSLITGLSALDADIINTIKVADAQDEKNSNKGRKQIIGAIKTCVSSTLLWSDSDVLPFMSESSIPLGVLRGNAALQVTE